MARNASDMKMGNMLEIIDLVRQGPTSRAAVARATGLTRAAVTIIVDRLISAGLISEHSLDNDGKCRKPIQLELGDRLRFMGVDISRAGCTIGLMDLKGATSMCSHFAIVPDDPFERVLPRIIETMRRISCSLRSSRKLIGIGVSVPGPVDAKAGVTLNPPNFKMLQNQRILDQLRGGADCAIWLDNNAAARTLFEKNLGQARRFNNFMTMIVDTGVGSGLVLDGKLFRGAGYAGEAGHVSIDRQGERCVCGNRGCLELYAAIPVLIRREGKGRPDLADWPAGAEQALAGDGRARAIIGQEAAYLAQSIVNTANLLDLEAVILTGMITYKPELLLEAIRQHVQAARITGSIHRLEILAAQPRPDDAAASAATIALDKFLTGQTDWCPI